MRASVRGFWLLSSFWALAACTGTRTGNPATGDAADGAKLIRSALARDDSPDVSEEQRAQLGSDNRAFAFDLYGQVKGADGNLFLSPYSISVALAMTYAGAEGETESEMSGALHFALPEPELHAAFNAADLELQRRPDQVGESKDAGKGLRLELTNALFVQSGAKPGAQFLDTLAVSYDSGVQALDIAADPEKARDSINGWVAEHTEQRIEQLLPPGSLDEALFVLVNAIYFKAGWLLPFDPKQTADATFHAPSGDVTASMMHQNKELAYATGDGFAAVELPYLSPDVRMLVVLPDAGRFDEIEAALDAPGFDQIRSQLASAQVVLSMPKFSFGSGFTLNSALAALGMPRAFDDRADFSDILPGTFISLVAHQAFVAVDEDGTEATAATAVVGSKDAKIPDAELTLDRPFLFAIYDQPTGQILFLGRVTDPSATGS